MRILTFLFAAILVFGFVKPAAAELPRFEFDKAHTSIVFYVDHLGFAKSTGRFLDFHGGFTFDPARVTESEIDVTIKTASIVMHDDRWDAHMKNEDFFDVENHPDMHFRSTDIEVTGENTGKVTGDLTLLGVTKPVTLDVTFNKADMHPRRPWYMAGFSATGTLKRSEFGMTYGLPAVGDEVEFRIEVEGYYEVKDTLTAEDKKN